MKTLTVDALITVARSQVVLIRRAKPPFMDRLVMPGGHVEESDESLAAACVRELEEEIGLLVQPQELRELMTLDTLGRDPRKSVSTSVVFTLDFATQAELASCQAGSDALEIVIRDIATLMPEEIGFDHYLAIAALKTQE